MNKIIQGDALEVLKTLESESIDCIITSPPYWSLRDYNMSFQIGNELTYYVYLERMVKVFDEARRVLKIGGTCWVNIGDTYSQKQLLQIPSRFSIEMCNHGWILRNEIIWQKPNAMPQSIKDRFTVDFEKIYFFVKSQEYYFNQQLQESVNRNDLEYRHALRRKKGYTMKKPYENNFPKKFREDGKRNMRSIWSIATKPFKEAHFATFPESLVEPMIRAGCPEGGVVLDMFMGAGTTAIVALKNNRKYLGIELNPEYIKIAEDRIKPFSNKLF